MLHYVVNVTRSPACSHRELRGRNWKMSGTLIFFLGDSCVTVILTVTTTNASPVVKRADGQAARKKRSDQVRV